MVGKEDQGVLQSKLPDVTQLIRRCIDRVGARQPGAEAVPCLRALRLDGRHHLLETATCVGLHVTSGAPRLLGERGDPRRELRSRDDVVHGQLHGPPDQPP